MKKQYYVHYYNKFGNTYNLYWANSPEMKASLPEGSEQISRKKAIQLCKEEKFRAKYDPAFSGYASSTIIPAGYPDNENIQNDNNYTLIDGYIWCKIQ